MHEGAGYNRHLFRERKMKKLLTAIVSAFLLFAVLIIPSQNAMAQSIGSVVYDFSSYPITSGANSKFFVSQATMGSLLAKYADGTLAVDSNGMYYADSAAVSSLVASIAAIYDMPGSLQMDQAAERQYITNLITSGSSEASHVPMMTSVTAQAAAQTDDTDTTGADKESLADKTASVIKSASELAAIEREEAEKAAIAAANEAIEKAAEANRLAENAAIVASIPNRTYIDVDITSQRLSYYIDGRLTLVSDIVTGNTSRHHDTPTGLYTIYGKQRNRTLKGDNYEAFVNYWMPFTGNYGLHDATWRRSFGGTIYQRDGSHGCVNLPKTIAATLYETAPVGTYVFVHQ